MVHAKCIYISKEKLPNGKSIFSSNTKSDINTLAYARIQTEREPENLENYQLMNIALY